MYVCTYVSHAWALGRHTQAPHACRVVTWFARVSRGYMVCTRARVTWLHGFPSPIALALPRVARSASFNAVAFTSIYLFIYLYPSSVVLVQLLLRHVQISKAGCMKVTEVTHFRQSGRVNDFVPIVTVSFSCTEQVPYGVGQLYHHMIIDCGCDTALSGAQHICEDCL